MIIAKFILLSLSFIASFYAIYILIYKLDKDIKTEISFIFSSVITLSSFSFLFFISLISGINYLLLFAIFPALLFAYFKIFNKNTFNYIPKISKIDYYQLSVFVGILIFSSSFFLTKTTYDGGWDAWAIWNPHAKFLTSENWNLLVAGIIDSGHPDYPLMLPSLIAINWKTLNSFSNLIPIFFAIFIYILITFTLFRSNKNSFLGLILASYLMFDSNFYTMALSQYADTLLSLFFLLTVLSFSLFRNKDAKLLAITGFFASSSAWVKNEGLGFFLIFSIILIIFYNWKKYKNILYFFVGAMFPLIIIGIFKIFYSPHNDLVASSGKTYSQLLDFERFKIIIEYFYNLLTSKYIIVIISIFSLILLRNLKILFSVEFLTLFFTLSLYFIVYMMSPYGIEWHLKTSANRLFLQLFPAFLFIVGKGISLKLKNS